MSPIWQTGQLRNFDDGWHRKAVNKPAYETTSAKSAIDLANVGLESDSKLRFLDLSR